MKLGDLFRYISGSTRIQLYEDLIWDEPGKVKCLGIFTREGIPLEYLDYDLTGLSPSFLDRNIWNIPVIEIYVMKDMGSENYEWERI